MGGAANWVEWKNIVVGFFGLDRDAVHIYIALFIFLCASVLFRRGMGSFLAFLIVAAFTLFNEYLDLLFAGQWPNPNAKALAELQKDAINSLAVPLLLFILTRWAAPVFFPQPDKFRRLKTRLDTSEPESQDPDEALPHLP